MSDKYNIALDSVSSLEKILNDLHHIRLENLHLRIEYAFLECQHRYAKKLLEIDRKHTFSINKIFKLGGK